MGSAKKVLVCLIVLAVPSCAKKRAQKQGPAVPDGKVDGSCAKAGPQIVRFTATIRDFKQDHPDFEKAIADDRGIVAKTLGSDGKPVYVHATTTTKDSDSTPVARTPTTTGKANFDQWYRDVPAVNQVVPVSLDLVINDGMAIIDHDSYFPIDGKGFGNESNDHNYHFTTEVHAEFVFAGGETFNFSGDDDVWVFVNDHLVLDLGGIHGRENMNLAMDAIAKDTNLVPGKPYFLDIFHAERHTTQSTFTIQTNVKFVKCAVKR